MFRGLDEKTIGRIADCGPVLGRREEKYRDSRDKYDARALKKRRFRICFGGGRSQERK